MGKVKADIDALLEEEDYRNLLRLHDSAARRQATNMLILIGLAADSGVKSGVPF